MKKILLLFSTLVFACNLSAQNYDNYLQNAYSALNEEKIEVAQSSYNVYKKMTGKSDLDFEILINDKINNDWTKACHIIDLGGGYSLAVQTTDNIPLTFDIAIQVCHANRLGGFTDWRLPSVVEYISYFSQVKNVCNETKYYWTRDKVSRYNGRYWEELHKVITPELQIKNASINISYNYLIVRTFKR